MKAVTWDQDGAGVPASSCALSSIIVPAQLPPQRLPLIPSVCFADSAFWTTRRRGTCCSLRLETKRETMGARVQVSFSITGQLRRIPAHILPGQRLPSLQRQGDNHLRGLLGF